MKALKILAVLVAMIFTGAFIVRGLEGIGMAMILVGILGIFLFILE
jgi:hypothetical protein